VKTRNFMFYTTVGLHRLVKWNERRPPGAASVIWDAGVLTLRDRWEYDCLPARAEALLTPPPQSTIFGGEDGGFWRVIPDYPNGLLGVGLTQCLMRTVRRIEAWRPSSGYPSWCVPVLQYAPNGHLSYWWRRTIDAYGRCPLVLGIGGLCRHLGRLSSSLVAYVNQVVNHWLLQPREYSPKRLHFFGLPMAGIKALAWCLPRLSREGLSVSVDSTKWTRSRSQRGLPSARNAAERWGMYEDYCNEIRRTIGNAVQHALLEPKA